MSSFDPYQVLEIDRDADSVTVRRAYQKLARRYHPDLYPGDPNAERRFLDVARAYRVLSDPELRRRHDVGLLEAERGLEPAPPGARRGSVAARFKYEAFLEVHAEWTASGEAEPRGDDLTAELTLELAEAVRGTTTSFSLQRERACEECGGAGEGLTAVPCERCAGRGLVVDLDRIRVRIPPGVDGGTRLRLPGKGNVDADGGAGDLFLTVRVRPHAYFRRHGLDIHGDVPVTFAEAVLGADLEVPTLDGPVRVRLPAGTSGGQRFRLRRRGVRLPGGRTGDHFYSVRIVVPRDVDEETRALIERLPGLDPRRGLPTEPV
jgi:DnaJ-class molecular chaperone